MIQREAQTAEMDYVGRTLAAPLADCFFRSGSWLLDQCHLLARPEACFVIIFCDGTLCIDIYQHGRERKTSGSQVMSWEMYPPSFPPPGNVMDQCPSTTDFKVVNMLVNILVLPSNQRIRQHPHFER